MGDVVLGKVYDLVGLRVGSSSTDSDFGGEDEGSASDK
jgi:hypothetical protein